MKCNKSVGSLYIRLERHLERGEIHNERIQLFATLATSGWSSIQYLEIVNKFDYISLRESEYMSNFILQSENFRDLRLQIAGDETRTIMESLFRTKVQFLDILFPSNFSLQNGRRFATALGRCTCITDLLLDFRFPRYSHQVELFQIFFLESIPKMLVLKILRLITSEHTDQGFIDMVGRCIGLHQGEIEELNISLNVEHVNSSMVGLVTALRRLKAIQFVGDYAGTLTPQ